MRFGRCRAAPSPAEAESALPLECHGHEVEHRRPLQNGRQTQRHAMQTRTGGTCKAQKTGRMQWDASCGDRSEEQKQKGDRKPEPSDSIF
eukprot:6193292-Pleurochrysis_carterae.AAC.3